MFSGKSTELIRRLKRYQVKIFGKLFSSSPAKRSNKLERLSSASLSGLANVIKLFYGRNL
jgi:thymidine kinase